MIVSTLPLVLFLIIYIIKQNIVELIISKNPVNITHHPLFDIGGMRIGQIKQTFGKMAHDRMLV